MTNNKIENLPLTIYYITKRVVILNITTVNNGQYFGAKR